MNTKVVVSLRQYKSAFVTDITNVQYFQFSSFFWICKKLHFLVLQVRQGCVTSSTNKQ